MYEFEAEIMVVWAVFLLVVASVAWLALHGWRQGRTLLRWAEERDLPVAGPDGPPADAWLEPFCRDDDQMTREMGRVRETVELSDAVRLFRCEETLDLAPWVSGSGPSRTRIVAAFPFRDGWETYSVFDEDGREASDPPPGLRFADRSVGRRIETTLRDPPHPVSVSVGDGRGIAYLLTPSGRVEPDDLDYLAGLGRRLARLSEDGREAADPADGREGRRRPEDARRTPAEAGGGSGDDDRRDRPSLHRAG